MRTIKFILYNRLSIYYYVDKSQKGASKQTILQENYC